MKANRMEAFSDGVLAIIITIMVLEFKLPEGHDWHALIGLGPKVLSYILSFVYVGIYWNNHHHLLHMVRKMNGRLMWLNLLLLFWLSLVPFTTAWMGESQFAATPTALYGIILLFAAFSYWLLQRAIINQHSDDSAFVVAMRKLERKIIFFVLLDRGLDGICESLDIWHLFRTRCDNLVLARSANRACPERSLKKALRFSRPVHRRVSRSFFGW